MAGITTAMVNTFRKESWSAGHDFSTSGGSTFKIALFINSVSGTYGKATTNYSDMTSASPTDEVANGSGYTTGGKTLTNVDPSVDTDVAITDFDDQTWTTATFSSDGTMIYNSSLSNACVSLHDFGGTKTASGGDFALVFPAAAAATAILRLA
jgi:hypothetical protein